MEQELELEPGQALGLGVVQEQVLGKCHAQRRLSSEPTRMPTWQGRRRRQRASDPLACQHPTRCDLAH